MSRFGLCDWFRSIYFRFGATTDSRWRREVPVFLEGSYVFGADRLDVVLRPVEHSCMERSIVADSELVPGGAKRSRRWHTVEEKRRIVEETLVSGASVSQVARLHGVNANQVFQWRRQYQAGDLVVAEGDAPKLLPVIATDSSEVVPSDEPAESHGGSIHIEFPGRALVTIEAGVDPTLLATPLSSIDNGRSLTFDSIALINATSIAAMSLRLRNLGHRPSTARPPVTKQ